MKIYYRASANLSSHPNPLGKDKYQIITKCFDSFKQSLTDQELTIIADHMPKEWLEIFEGFPIVETQLGNVGTFHWQLETVSNLEPDEKVFLVEDDYLWTDDAIYKIELALDELDLVSPYDHPGHYTEPRFKDQPKKMVLVGNHTYREAPSNTLTFATKAGLVRSSLDLMKSYGISDHPMFQALGAQMYVPVPSLATHMVEGLLAPNVEWDI